MHLLTTICWLHRAWNSLNSRDKPNSQTIKTANYKFSAFYMFTKLFIFAYCRAYAGSPHDVQSGFWSKTTVENHYLTITCLVWWTVFKNDQIFVLVKSLKICWNEVTERRNFSFIIHLIFHLLWNNSLPLLFDLFPNPLMCCAISFIKMKCKHTIILEDTLSSLHTNTHTHRHVHISYQKLPIRQMPAAAHTHTRHGR